MITIQSVLSQSSLPAHTHLLVRYELASHLGTVLLCKRTCTQSFDRILLPCQHLSFYTAVHSARRMAKHFQVRDIFIHRISPGSAVDSGLISAP